MLNRTDNAIKNHWNSSVKKKLDSYLASGLLEQFQALPLVAHQNQTMPSSSSRMQSSGDDNCPKCGTEAEEISECSQESTFVGCSQSGSDLGNAVLHTREEFQFAEESGLRIEQSSSPASCSEQYYTSLGDTTFSIPEIPCEVGGPSNVLRQNFSHNTVTSVSRDYHFNLQELPNMSSLELGQESSGLPTHCIAANESHELVNVPFQTSVGLNAPSVGNITANSTKAEHMLISDEECCRILFSEAINGGLFLSENLAKGSDMVELGGCTESLLPQSLKMVSETDRTSASQSYCPSQPGVLGTSCSQSFMPGPSVLSADDCTQIYSREPNKLIGHSFGTHEQEFITSVHDGFLYTNDTANSPCDDGTDNTGPQEQLYLKEPSKLVPVNTFTSGSDAIQSCPADERPNVHTEQHDAGALCYEPPRFPSFDIPFLSCDLIQSGGDMQQEYSPLGIRQLMMSSMNCITPFRLWDSPSRDDSPDAVLKSAAKTFTGTPSILKKRNRDLLSPLSERRYDKKLEIDMTSSLTKEFSRLDVMFDDSETQRSSLPSPSSYRKRNHESSSEDKENQDPALEGGQQKGRDGSAFLDNELLDKDFDSSDSQDNIRQGAFDSDAKTKVHPEAQIVSFSPIIFLLYVFIFLCQFCGDLHVRRKGGVHSSYLADVLNLAVTLTPLINLQGYEFLTWIHITGPYS